MSASKGDDQARKGISRRVFLGAAAAGGALAALGYPLAPGLRALTTSSRAGSGEKARWVASTCQGCTSWCAAEVQVVEGRAVKVRGNRRSLVHGGASCPRPHLALQQVYDPDRIKTPMKRTNPKKGRDQDPGFVPISWDEALELMAEKIMELRRAGETHKYMLMRGRYSYMRDIIYDRMTKIIGSPNNISHSAICAEAEKFGSYYTEGYWGYRQYDVAHTRYLLLWSSDPLSSNRQVSYYCSVWGEVMDRATIAVVDPRLSITAGKADEWLPVAPGQDGALAAAIAHLILVEGLWYRPFVGDFKDGQNRFMPGREVAEEDFQPRYTHGLVRWWNLELKDKTPEWAARRCGLPASQIRRVARGYGKAAPHCISWVGPGACMNPRGGYTAMICHALNGLTGGVDNLGGTLAANKTYIQKFPDPTPFLDHIAKQGKKHEKIDQRGRLQFPSLKKKPGKAVVTNHAAEGILNKDPYEIKVAIAYMNNFAFSTQQPRRWEKALAAIPFLVHITTNASEFSWFADLVLPDTHHLFEKWGFVKSIGNGRRQVPIMQPVIKPMWLAKTDETEIPWLLGQRLAKKGFPNLLDYCRSLKDPETGKEPADEREFALYALKLATQKLWDPEHYQGGDRFGGWEEFRRAGVWNSDPYPYRARWGRFKTKTRMFEFYSETLKEQLEAHARKHGVEVDKVLEVCQYQARGERAFVPHYEEPLIHGDPGEYPLVLVDHKSRLNREGRSANCSWYYEFKDVDPGDRRWDDVAKINPQDAARLGLGDGDEIRLVSPIGELKCRARLWEGVRPGTVAKCYGQGHWVYGRLASRVFGKVPRGGSNNDLIPADYDRLSGSSARNAVVRVRIERVQGDENA